MSYVKLYKYKKQVSYDQGQTWEDVTPAVIVPSGTPIGVYDTYNDCIAQYRTIQSGTTCAGTHGVDKHNQDVYEVSYDNGVTWEVVSTSAGTLIEANSEDCGYSARTVSTGTTCAGNHGVNKYQLIENQESYDYGVTWITISSSRGSLIEANSPDCGYAERTISTGTTCVGVDKYQLIENQVSYNYGSTWTTTGTSTGSLIEANSYDCGYRTRQTSGTPYCTGYDKYVDVSNQVSTDYGNTWTTISTAATMVEHNSEDCGYVPPFDGKYKLTSNDSSIVTAACDATSAITQRNISGYSASTTSAEIGRCVIEIGATAFYRFRKLASVTIPDNMITIGQNAFKECVVLTDVIIPDSVTSMGQSAFQNCSGLTSISISSGLTVINYATFWGCQNLKRVNSNVDGLFNLPNGLTTIGTAAFGECYKLTGITIPDSVTSIEDDAFGYCIGLKNVTISFGITSIGEYAFADCSSLTGITINAPTPPSLGQYAFDGTNNCPIYVPSGSVNTYKTTSGWSTYASRIQAIP
jgi:hypothetical protein